MSQWLAIALIVIIALQIMVILTLLHLGAVLRPTTRGPVEATQATIDALELVGMEETQAKSLMRDFIITEARGRGVWRA